MTTVEVIVPWAGGCPHREAALDWVLRRYVTYYPAWKVTLAAWDGPWVKAEAVMPAVEASDADIVVAADADSWCPVTDEAVLAVAAGRVSWAAPHWRTHRFTAAYTARVLAGADPSHHSSDSLEERPMLGTPGGGIIVAARPVLLDVPLDPRFEGWGGEDWSWGRALRTLHGKPWRGAAPLWHLWHPPQARPARHRLPPANDALRQRYAAAYGRPPTMRSLLNEISGT